MYSEYTEACLQVTEKNLCSILESLVCEILDLSGQGLKKLSRCPSDADISTLIIDDNDLQRLDNLDSYHRITKVIYANLYKKILLIYIYNVKIVKNGLTSLSSLRLFLVYTYIYIYIYNYIK